MRLTPAHCLYIVTVYSYTLPPYRPRLQRGILTLTLYKIDLLSKLNTKAYLLHCCGYTILPVVYTLDSGDEGVCV